MAEFKDGIKKFYLGDSSQNPKAEVTYINHDENTIIINHTFVSPELRGQHIGGQLIKRVVDFARAENKKIIPVCSFAVKEFNENKDYNDVLFKEKY